MAIVAECADSTPPADGAAYSACTNVIWVNEVSFSLPDWTFEQYGEIAGSLWVFFIVLWVVRAVRKQAI